MDTNEEMIRTMHDDPKQAYDYFSTRIDKQVDGNLPAFYLYFILSCDVETYTSDAICDKKNGLKRIKVYPN